MAHVTTYTRKHCSRDILTQQNELRAGEDEGKQERLNKTVTTFPFICNYPKQMLRQMEFPRQLDVIP